MAACRHIGPSPALLLTSTTSEQQTLSSTFATSPQWPHWHQDGGDGGDPVARREASSSVAECTVVEGREEGDASEGEGASAGTEEAGGEREGEEEGEEDSGEGSEEDGSEGGGRETDGEEVGLVEERGEGCCAAVGRFLDGRMGSKLSLHSGLRRLDMVVECGGWSGKWVCEEWRWIRREGDDDGAVVACGSRCSGHRLRAGGSKAGP